jgi:lipid II isoglutaminyl synthase (glutamine-hydrolysing)
MTPSPGEPRAGTLGGRTRVAATATVAVGEASKLLRRGSGSVIGGRVGLAIDPGLVARLSAGKRCALVTGTNGKTTTTRFLVAALGGPEVVASSGAGANLPAGLASALASSQSKTAAVLEVDEAYLGSVAKATSPEVIVLLNLSRDQLDRVNEVRMLAERWRDAMSALSSGTGPQVTIVANADDPLVTWAAGSTGRGSPHAPGPRVLFVAAGELWHEDATGCPSCGGRITFGPDGGWSCECGFARPEVHASLTPAGLELATGRVIPFSLSMPARCNRANASMAAVAASVFGKDEADSLAAMSAVREVQGRFQTLEIDGVTTRLLLAKNPAGWAELLDLLDGSELPVVIGINSRIADGHDPSWLWDVPYERLAGRRIVATGERCRDLAVRLEYAGVEHQVESDQRKALLATGAPAVEYVGNYTAFQQLRSSIARGSRSNLNAHLGNAPLTPSKDTPRNSTYQARHVPKPGERSPESALRIVVVHPDLLGTYGDGGNGRVLACRAAWRGWPVELILASSGSPLPTADLYCLGGGEDGPQVESAELLEKSVLADAVSNGAAVLAVCAGFQIVGSSFPDSEGRSRDGLGLLEVVTMKNTEKRLVGEVLSEPVEPTLGGVRLKTFTGFENHSGLTRLGPGVAPLAMVLSGGGNGDGTGAEGAVSSNVVGTYLHGPVLARNPSLADALLSLATKQIPDPLSDDEEQALRAERLAAGSAADGLGSRGVAGVLQRLVRTRRT